MSLRKRYYTRHPISLDVSVRHTNGWVHYRTVDVSRRGVFLRTDEPSPLHRLLQMRIELPGEDALDVMGRVRRSVATREESPIGPGMGIEFFVMSEPQQDAWDRFVLSQPHGDPGTAPGEGALAPGAAVPLDIDLPNKEEVDEGPSDERTMLGIPRGQVQQAVADGLAEAKAQLDEASGALTQALEGADESDTSDTPEPADTSASEASPQGVDPGQTMPITSAARRQDDAPPPLPDLPEDEQEPDAPAASTDVADLPSLHVVVRPGDRKQLDGFVVRRLGCRPVLLRIEEPARVGQSVVIVLVHPETDRECHLKASVQRTVDADEHHGAGIQVGFSEADAERRAELRRFVELGTHAEPTAPAADNVEHDALLEQAQRRPESATAQTELGWSFISPQRVPEAAIDAFLAALAIDGDCIEAHRGLSLAYALAGDAHRAYAFASSWRQLEQQREAAESG